jgi:hypothetical protein
MRQMPISPKNLEIRKKEIVKTVEEPEKPQ